MTTYAHARLRASHTKPVSVIQKPGDPWEDRRGKRKDTEDHWLYCPVDEFMQYLHKREKELQQDHERHR